MDRKRSPNPTGSDTDNEWIEIKNNDKKKVNLRDWKIATGKDLVNHSIINDILVLPGKIVRLTRSDAPFSFNNTKDTIELAILIKKVPLKLNIKKKKLKMMKFVKILMRNATGILQKMKSRKKKF